MILFPDSFYGLKGLKLLSQFKKVDPGHMDICHNEEANSFGREGRVHVNSTFQTIHWGVIANGKNRTKRIVTENGPTTAAIGMKA